VTDVGDGNSIEALVTYRAEKAFVTIEKTQNFKTPSGGGRDDAVKDGIQTWTIPSAR
jgi:hypothetical protein